MKRVPISECPAGPWLDAAVAQARGSLVFSQPDFGRWFVASSIDAFHMVMRSGEFIETDSSGPMDFCYKLPRYSIDIAAAWELVEELKMRCGYDPEGGDPFAFVSEGTHTWMSFAETVPLAVARAYLWIKGVTEVEIPE